MNTLYYGDNLSILRDYIADDSIDLIYLDPPFNSKATYNVLFKSATGSDSQAQVTAFEDTWHWTSETAEAFDQVMSSGNSQASEMLRAFREFMGENDMMAYLTMMAIRLIELRRVLKPTGCLFLHCDPTASHYLKILLDAIFSPLQCRNEIVWRRTGSHNKSRRFGPIHDIIHFYTKTDNYYFKTCYTPYSLGHVESYFKKKDEGGRYWTNALTGAGIRKGLSGKNWRTFNPTGKNRHWAIPSKIIDYLGINPNLNTLEKLDLLEEAGFLLLPSKNSDAMPTYKQYLNQSPGIPFQDIWAYQPHTRGTLYNEDAGIDEDVRWLSKQGDSERLGYPTQKPVGLLERIIQTACPKGGIVLDPFCGCGTTIHTAEKQNRPWIGIDITHLAISLIERRLADAFPKTRYQVHGTPKDLGGAVDLADRSKYEFQWWVTNLVNGIPFGGKKKGADQGIDGIIYFKPDTKRTQKAIISVKGGQNVSVEMIRSLIAVCKQQKSPIGIFITLAPPTRQMRKTAASEGFYDTDFGRFPRIQILTVDQLFMGARPLLPYLDPSASFKQAKIEDTESRKQAKLFE